MEKFIVVNGRILDFGKYENDFSMMQKIIILDVKEYFKKLGFRQSPLKNKRLLRQRVNFYNAELDFEVTIATNKKHGLQFI